MPTYGYLCPQCQTEFEVLQRMTDDPAADCPRCGSPGRRLFFPTGIVFKGSGFYKTDSRRAATASVNGGGAGGEAKTAAGGKPASEGGKQASESGKSGSGEKAAGGTGTSTSGTAPAGGVTST